MRQHATTTYLHSKIQRSPLIKGTLILTATGLLTRIIGFFYRIYLSRLFGEENMGIYQLISPVLVLSFSITSAGIQTALSKYIASECSHKEQNGMFHYLLTGLLLTMSLSFIVAYIIYRYSEGIAENLLLEPRTAPLLRILALSVPLSGFHSIINGYFYGIKDTKLPAVTQLAEQLVRVASVFFICSLFIKRGTAPSISVAVAGLFTGECASFLISLLALYGRFAPFRKQLVLPSTGRAAKLSKKLLSLSIPLSANRIVINLLQSVEAVYIPSMLLQTGLQQADALRIYGVLTGMALPLILFPSAITNSVSVLLLPMVSEAQALGNNTLIKQTVHRACKYCILLGGICTLGFFLFGPLAGILLFHSTMAGTFIQILSFICPFLYLSATLSSILHGLGKTFQTFLVNLIALSFRLCFVFFCIPVYGIKGYLIGLLTSQLLAALLDYIILRQYIKA